MAIDCSYKKYARIVEKQEYLKLHYEKKFLCYKNILNNYFQINNLNKYAIVFKMLKLKEIETLILDKLNNEFNERYYQFEEEKNRLITIVNDCKKINYIQYSNVHRFSLIYYLLFILFLVIIMRFV